MLWRILSFAVVCAAFVCVCEILACVCHKYFNNFIFAENGDKIDLKSHDIRQFNINDKILSFM